MRENALSLQVGKITVERQYVTGRLGTTHPQTGMAGHPAETSFRRKPLRAKQIRKQRAANIYPPRLTNLELLRGFGRFGACVNIRYVTQMIVDHGVYHNL